MQRKYNMTDNQLATISFPIIFSEKGKDPVYGENLYWAIDDNSFGLEGINIFPKAKGGGRVILTIREDGASVKEILKSIA